MSMSEAQRRRQQDRSGDGRYISRSRAESEVTLEAPVGHNEDADVYRMVGDQRIAEMADHSSRPTTRLAVSSSAHDGVAHLSATDPDPVVRVGVLAKEWELTEGDRARLREDEDVARVLERVLA